MSLRQVSRIYYLDSKLLNGIRVYVNSLGCVKVKVGESE